MNIEASPEARAVASRDVSALDSWLSARTVREADPAWQAMFTDARVLIKRFRDNPAMFELLPAIVVPPGSPVGAETSR